MNTTTRRHPRTLNDAFSNTADYGCALHVYRRHPVRKMFAVVAWIFVLLGIFALTMQGLPCIAVPLESTVMQQEDGK